MRVPGVRGDGKCELFIRYYGGRSGSDAAGRYGRIGRERARASEACGGGLEWDMAAKVTSARFVGRERELARLAVALEQAESGRSTTLLIAGTGGAGASRLLD